MASIVINIGNGSKKKASRKRGKSSSKTENKHLKYKVIIPVVGVAFLLVIWLIISIVQNDPSRRLSETINACLYNENSRSCVSAQKKYSTTFKYCHSLADIPEVGKDIPKYGVAFFKDFNMPINDTDIPHKLKDQKSSIPANALYNNGLTQQKLHPDEEDRTTGWFPYYACADSPEEMGSDLTDQLANEPKTLALYMLKEGLPKAEVIDKSSGWTMSIPNNNNGWTIKNSIYFQIPNISSVLNEYHIAFEANRKSSSEVARNSIAATNNKFSSYVSNPKVQRWYQIYDAWISANDGGGLSWASCNLGEEKSFQQYCLSEEGYTMSDFAKNMQEQMSGELFTSKTIAQ